MRDNAKRRVYGVRPRVPKDQVKRNREDAPKPLKAPSRKERS